MFMIQNKTKDADLGLDSILDRGERSIDRCDKIITQMLDFARSTKLKAEPALIDQWLDSVLQEQELLDGITVIRESEAPDVVIAFESERLRRAVINIFDNGLQAIVECMKDGETTPHNGDDACCWRSLRNALCRHRRRDGREDREKIFEPLFSTKTYGTGLGMPTVRQIMEVHGGGIEIESAPSEGTTMILWLPTEKSAVEAS